MMKDAYEVVVIGGGIVGSAVTFELEKRGIKDVLLLEKGALTSGATGRCAAGIRQQWGSELNCQIALDSTQIFEKIEEYTGYDKSCGLTQNGYLLVAYTDEELEQFTKNLKVQNSLGIHSYAVDKEGMLDIVPYLNLDGVKGGTFCPKDGYLNPFHTTNAYARGAEKLGADVATYTEALDFTTEDGKITGVMTSKGYVKTKYVINCANTWAPKLAAKVGEDIPVTTERHQIYVTEPVDHFLDPLVMAFSRSYYVQQTPNGSLILGGAPEVHAENYNTSWQFLERSCYEMCEMMPILRKLNIVRSWAGFYDMSPDRHPIIDEAKAAKGFYSVCGFSSHGFMVAPRIAILVANRIAGIKDDLNIELFSQKRFETGDILIEPSIVEGKD
ncbi:NAD(P)/FAD-dependent oxidoreductase [Agathobacter sp.]